MLVNSFNLMYSEWNEWVTCQTRSKKKKKLQTDQKKKGTALCAQWWWKKTDIMCFGHRWAGNYSAGFHVAVVRKHQPCCWAAKHLTSFLVSPREIYSLSTADWIQSWISSAGRQRSIWRQSQLEMENSSILHPSCRMANEQTSITSQADIWRGCYHAYD